MDRLEWCRENCPKLWRDLPDDELISKMTDAWEIAQLDNKTESEEPMEEHSLNIINNHLDYMVIELTKEFGNKLAFKGGYMLTKLLPNSARQTTDIDFSILSEEVYTSIKDTLTRISEHFKKLGIIDDYIIKDRIQRRMSGGADLYKNGEKILGVDVGWHDITYGTQLTKIDVAEVNAFLIERMVADKVTAIMSRKRFRRTKDIYDLYCLSHSFDIDLQKVKTFIDKRGEETTIEWHNYPFSEDVLREYEKAYNALKVNSIYENKVIAKPDFGMVYSRFGVIVEKLLNLDGYDTWCHKSQMFSRGDCNA